MITNLSLNKIVIVCKWIYKIKYNFDGYSDKYKDRLVANECTQLKVLDYTNIFFPIAKLTIVR